MKSVTILDSTKSNIASEKSSSYLEELSKLEQKNEKGNYKYLTPKKLNADAAKNYEETINKIFSTYSSILRELVGFIRKTTEKPQNSSKAEWKSSTSMQATSIASVLLPLAALVERDAKYPKPHLSSRKLTKLADELIPQTLSPGSETLDLIAFSPRNELELVEEILFELSAQPYEEIERVVDEISFDQRIGLFRQYLSSGSLLALAQASYEWEIVESVAKARQISALAPGVKITFQEFSPRHGYDVPKIVEQAGVSELFEKCFDMSYELYSKLQMSGYEQEAELATLLGHRLRWRLKCDANQLRRIVQRDDFETDSTKSFRINLHEKWQDAHPTISEGLFPN